MRVFHSMSTYDFAMQLRDVAIRAGARALVIDQIDAIAFAPNEEDIRDDLLTTFADDWKDARKEAAERLEDDDIGLTEIQIKQVLEIIDELEPKP